MSKFLILKSKLNITIITDASEFETTNMCYNELPAAVKQASQLSQNSNLVYKIIEIKTNQQTHYIKFIYKGVEYNTNTEDLKTAPINLAEYELFEKFKATYMRNQNYLFANPFSKMKQLLKENSVRTLADVTNYIRQYPNSRSAQILQSLKPKH